MTDPSYPSLAKTHSRHHITEEVPVHMIIILFNIQLRNDPGLRRLDP